MHKKRWLVNDFARWGFHVFSLPGNTNKERELDSRRMKRDRILRLFGVRSRLVCASTRHLPVEQLVGAIIHQITIRSRKQVVCSTRKAEEETHPVVSATGGRNSVGVVSHLPDEHRVSLVGDEVLEALEIRLQNRPQLLCLALPSGQLEEADAFDVVEERVPVLRQFVRLLSRGGGWVVRGQ